MIRALIEAASLAVWILGPEDSDMRVARAMSFDIRNSTSPKIGDYSPNWTALSLRKEANAQEEFVNGQIQDLRLIADRAGISWGQVKRSANPGLIAEEAGSFVPRTESSAYLLVLVNGKFNSARRTRTPSPFAVGHYVYRSGCAR